MTTTLQQNDARIDRLDPEDAAARAAELLPEILAYTSQHAGEGCWPELATCSPPALDERGIGIRFVQTPHGPVLHVVEHHDTWIPGAAEERDLGTLLDQARQSHCP